METKLTKILAELTTLAERAQEVGDDNATMAHRYSDVESALWDAISAIESAIDSLSDR